MPIDAKTIQIFLPEGEPQGLRVAEITTRIVQAVQVPRTKLQQFFGRRESEHVALYLLFGERDESPKPVVYIGQTEDLKARLRMHHANRDFWSSAIAVISRTQSFTQAHIRYLEWLSIKSAQEAGRFALDNGNSASKPYVTEPMEADVLDAFETASILVATLGFPVFEPAVGRDPAKKPQVFFCRGPNANARGALVEDGFVVFAGSTARRQLVPSAQDFSSWQRKLEETGVLIPVNDAEFSLTQDYVVNSPSYAASLVLARRANGWQEWKLEDGSTLHDVYRVNLPSPTVLDD